MIMITITIKGGSASEMPPYPFFLGNLRFLGEFKDPFPAMA